MKQKVKIIIILLLFTSVRMFSAVENKEKTLIKRLKENMQKRVKNIIRYGNQFMNDHQMEKDAAIYCSGVLSIFIMWKYNFSTTNTSEVDIKTSKEVVNVKDPAELGKQTYDVSNDNQPGCFLIKFDIIKNCVKNKISEFLEEFYVIQRKKDIEEGTINASVEEGSTNPFNNSEIIESPLTKKQLDDIQETINNTTNKTVDFFMRLIGKKSIRIY